MVQSFLYYPLFMDKLYRLKQQGMSYSFELGEGASGCPGSSPLRFSLKSGVPLAL